MKRFILALALLTACGKKEAPEQKPRPVLSTVVHASDGGHRTFPGAIAPRYSTQLAFRVGGRITKRLVTIGDKVKKGDIIATLDSGALASSAAAAQANVEAADAKQRNAEQNRAREQKLLASRAVTQSAMDDVQTSHDTASASVSEANARLRKSREDLSYGTLRADFDGIITKIDFEVEQTVSANQVIAEMARPDVIDVVVDVPENVASNLAVGNEARAYPADDPSVSANGQIRQMSPAADRLTRTYRIWIALPEPIAGVRLGATMYATFPEDFPAAVRVPVEAILDKDNAEYVWVVEGDTVHIRAVKCADRKGRRAVITEGVRDGDRVVIAGVHSLKEGQKIASEGGEAK